MTFDELKAAGFVLHHHCSICGEAVGYRPHPEFAAAVFDSGCGCSGGSNYRVLTWEELTAIPSPSVAA